MKHQITISIAGTDYPYLETMGALLAFKAETGIDPSQINADDTEGQLKYMYHVVKYSCKREDKNFTLTFAEFVDGLSAVEFARVTTVIGKMVQETIDLAKKKV